MKTHLADNDAPLCGTRVGLHTRLSQNAREVDCGKCQERPEFVEAKAAADAAREAAIMAQEPRMIPEPWHRELVYITCTECGHNLFRVGDRTCYGHYDNFHCGRCGHVESRLTETGMSF